MELLLIRHAKAIDGELYAEDGHRPLTADGRRHAQEVGAALAEEGISLDAMVTSPFVRAVETAELVACELGYEGALEVSATLEPGGRPQEIMDRVIMPRSVKRLALVGHEPSMGNLLSALLQKPGLSMSKGAAVRLSWDGKRGKLVWVVKPKKLSPVGSLDGL